MNRLEFIKNSSIGGLGCLLPIGKEDSVKKLTILHTNDIHSHIEPFDKENKYFSNMGGAAQRAKLIQKVRQKEDNVLLFDSGDIFQGTPYFNFFNGELDMKLLSAMKYDAATIGNHDFDNGIDGFDKQLKWANFPFLSANYNFANTVLDSKTLPYKIFKKDGLKIGVYGLGIKLNGLVNKDLYKETTYLDPVELSADTSQKLKKELKCDLVVCLSHLGYSYKTDKISDLKLAEQSKDVDIILGGHTHTFLKEPTIVQNSHNKEVLVNQMGWAGVYVGKIDIYFEKKKNETKLSFTDSPLPVYA